MKKKLFGKIFIFCFSQLASSISSADFKFDALIGYYNLKAETVSSSGTLSALGVYAFQIRKTLIKDFEFGIGYTLQTSNTFSGDISYGPDLGAYFYPFSNSSSITAYSETLSFKLQEKYKPYMGVNFHQRNYQSAKSSYAGFSLIGGCEFDIGSTFLLNAQLRFLNLQGSQNSKAQEFDILSGLTFSF